MTEDERAVPDCPMWFKACYPSFQCRACSFWRNGRCEVSATEENVDQYPEMSKPQLVRRVPTTKARNRG
ncbi:hypothetical protein ES707_13255 [subsurface metagenome]